MSGAWLSLDRLPHPASGNIEAERSRLLKEAARIIGQYVAVPNRIAPLEAPGLPTLGTLRSWLEEYRSLSERPS